MTSLLAALALGTAGFQTTPQQPRLSPDQLRAKLATVAVFTLADAEGKPLIADSDNGKDRHFGAFLSHRDAELTLADLQKSKPEIAAKLKVTPISLAQAFAVEAESQKTATPVHVSLVPDTLEVEAGKEQYKRQGQDPKLLKGVPIFVPKLKDKNTYLTLTVNNQPAYPFFLSMGDLRQLLDRFKQSNPAAAASLIVEITNLETVVQTLRTSNDEAVTQIAFIQSSQTRTYLKAIAEKGG